MNSVREELKAEKGGQGGASRRMKGWMAVATVVLLSVVGWAAWRYWQDGPWNNRAISAEFRDMIVQRQNDKDVHLLLHYKLRNATHKDYRLASPQLGVLMWRAAEGEMQEIDSVVWEPVAIPAGKTVEAEFDVTLASAEDWTREDSNHSDGELKELADQELSRMEGLVFFDYGKRYWIDLPRGWR